MNLPQDNEVVYEASLVEHHSSKSGLSLGCILGIVLGSAFFLMVVGLAVLVALLNPGSFSTPDPVSKESDFNEVKSFLATEGVPIALQRGHPTAHPDYDKINKFIKNLASRLDDTANRKVQKLIDHQRQWREVCKRSVVNFHYRDLTRSDMEWLLETSTGPPGFASEDYEILQIDSMAGGGYRVAISYDEGYGFESIFVWWLSKNKGRIRIYDWICTDLGMRESFEYGALCDLTPREEAANDVYIAAVDAYFEVDEDLEYEAYHREIKKTLRPTEIYGGARILKAKNELVAAKRWAYHDEPIEAMRLLKTIADPDSTPGVHLLRANINFDNGFYADAFKGYEDFVKVVGTSSFIKRRLIQCARELGDEEAEKNYLIEHCKHVDSLKSTEIGNLIELNSDAENQALYARIDASEDKESIYDSIVSRLKYKSYYQHQFEHLKSHLKATMPDAVVTRFAELTLSSKTKAATDTLAWLESLGPEKAAKHRYEFWYWVPDSKMLSVFEATDRKELNFKEFEKYYRYEDYFPYDMQQICELVLKENPESRLANRVLASLLLEEGEYAAAIEKLKVVLKNPGEDEDTSSDNYSMLRALYRNGDDKKAIAWAQRHNLINSLIHLKMFEKDLSGIEELLAKMDQESAAYKYQVARTKAARGETDAAAKDLIAMIEEAKTSETDNDLWRWQWELNRIYDSTGQPWKMVEAFPDEETFWDVADELITERNWEGCEKLLSMTEPSLSDAQLALRLSLDWANSRYEVLANIDDDLERLPTSPSNLSRVLEPIFNSCMQQGEFDDAKKWANKMDSGARRNEMLAGIDIRELKWSDAASRMRNMDESGRSYLPAQTHLWNDAAYDQPEITALIPILRLNSVDEGPALEQAFLFESEPELDAARLKGFFVPVLGDDVTTEKFPASTGSSWTTFSNQELTIVVRQSSPRYKKPPASYSVDKDEKEIQELFLKTRSRIDVSVYSSHPVSSAESLRFFDLIAKPFCDLQPQLFGSSNRWLTPDKFDAWFAATTKRESELYVSGDFRGIPSSHYRDVPEVDNEAKEAFKLELASSLQSFIASSDIEKSFVVQLKDDSEANRYLIDIDRIKRNRFGDVSLVGTVRFAENVPQIGALNGEVSITPSQIVRFQAAFDQQEIEGELR